MTYYSWINDNGSFNGLARMTPATDTSSSEWAFASAALHGWVRRPELYGYVLDGRADFVPITDEQAADLAARYGVDLAGPTEYEYEQARAAAMTAFGYAAQ